MDNMRFGRGDDMPFDERIAVVLIEEPNGIGVAQGIAVQLTGEIEEPIALDEGISQTCDNVDMLDAQRRSGYRTVDIGLDGIVEDEIKSFSLIQAF